MNRTHAHTETNAALRSLPQVRVTRPFVRFAIALSLFCLILLTQLLAATLFKHWIVPLTEIPSSAQLVGVAFVTLPVWIPLTVAVSRRAANEANYMPPLRFAATASVLGLFLICLAHIVLPGPGT